MELRMVLKKHKKDWIEEMEMNSAALQTNRLIDRLDQVATEYETKWGIGRLENLASAEIKERWLRQVDKINTAISESDHVTLKALLDGTIRGWAALEADVLKNGHKPNDPSYVEYEHPSGVLYKICYTLADAKMIEHMASDKVKVVTISEMANLMEAEEKRVYGLNVKCDAEEQKITFFDWQEGDALPF